MSATLKLSIGALVFCMVVLLGLESLLRPNHRERNYEALTEMVYSKAAESLGRSASLPGLMVQQPLTQGVVVRGHESFPYGPGPEEAVRAGLELTNPFGDEPEVLARGAVIYARTCVVCHAGDGMGQGSVVARGMAAPPAFLAARAMAIADGEMFHILTMGQGNMPSHAAQITRADRWRVIRHVRSLQGAAQ